MNAAWEALFDELAELEAGERARCLAALARQDPDLACFLGELLAADDGTLADLPGPLLERAPGFVAAALASAGPRTGQDRAGERIGNYRLLSLLGRGGMAEVWLAERADGEFDSRVALKLVRPELGSEEIVARFLRERRILARLTHPGIARLLDGGRSATGEPYFVLEQVEGTPLTDWCASQGASLEERLRLLIEVCEAVDHAHRSLIVHRDIKPSNVLVDRSGRPKLLDFGIAKLLSPEPAGALADTGELRLGALAFTPAYAAPEQILDEPMTTATDVYALGVLLYELLTGEKPHLRAAQPLPLLRREVAAEVLEPPSARRPGARLAGDLDAIAVKALARAPEQRYPGAAALAGDLRRFLAGRPVLARAQTPLYRARRFVRRHRLGIAAAALVVLSLCGGLAVALWQAEVARGEARRAERARGFLLSVFETLDPHQARGEDVTRRTLLAAAARRVERDFADEPLLQAEMLDLLADLHRKLGLLPEGRALAERSVRLRRRLSGETSAEAAQSLVTLGWIRLNQGDLTAARPLLERAVADLERSQGRDSLAAADAREPLVEVIFAAEGPGPALPALENRLATYRRLLGDTHEKTALALNDRGVLLLELGRLDEAEASYRQSLAGLAARLPADDPRLGYPHHNLGGLLLRRGRIAAAEKELRTALALRRRTLGDRHPETAMTQAILIQVLLEREQYGPAAAAARKLVADFADTDRFIAANARIGLAEILTMAGQPDEALPLFDRGIAELEKLVGEGQPLLWSARGERAYALLVLKREREGMEELQRAIQGLEEIGPAGDQQRWELLAALARERRRQGRTTEAWDLHQRVRRLVVRIYGEENSNVAGADFDL
ncbi:MAG TPA: serine/threonine-protein kinase, partial [Thermoanaerobaculia bacterium]|nr:serine/threonine-protein kinase [Thermoanaerobaculia bacterium]